MARKLCTKEGCEDQSISRGLCPKHYQALRRREKDPLVGTRRRGRAALFDTCSVEGCDNQGYARGMCVAHYRRTLRKLKRRSFSEKVLATWYLYDLDPEVLKWHVDSFTEEILFEVWTPEAPVELTSENLQQFVDDLRNQKPVPMKGN